MQMETRCRLEGLLRNYRRGLVPLMGDGGVWALDYDRLAPRLVGFVPRRVRAIAEYLAAAFAK